MDLPLPQKGWHHEQTLVGTGTLSGRGCCQTSHHPSTGHSHSNHAILASFLNVKGNSE